GALERADADPPQRHRNGDSLGRTEVQRRERHRLVHGVTAGPPGIGVDRDPGLLQRPDIPLDGPRADLVQRRQFPGAAAARRAGPKLLHQRVQPVGPVHILTVRPGTDKPDPAEGYARSPPRSDLVFRIADSARLEDGAAWRRTARR